MRILVVGRHYSLFPLSIQKDSRFIFLNNELPFDDWTLNGEKLPIFRLDDQSLPYLQNLIEFQQELHKLLPIWSRHFDDLPRIDEMVRIHALRIATLCQIMQMNKVSKVLFGTGVSHWIDDFVIEIACRKLKIKQVFLYPIVLHGRCLPLVQENGISSRRPMNKLVSDFSFRQTLNSSTEFKSSISLTGNSMEHRNFYLALIRIIQFYMRSLIGNILRKKTFTSALFPDRFRKHNFFTSFRLLQNQKRGIGTLQNYQNLHFKSIEEIVQRWNKPVLVLYAHLQPEATSFPEAGSLYDHIDLICHIRSTGYSSPILYKEHPMTLSYLDGWPSQSGMSRSSWYYETLASLNVLFLKEDNDLKFPHIAATLTGTIALERSLLGLETVIFGFPWFSGLPGTLTLREYMDRDLDDFTDTPPHEISLCAQEFLSQILDFKTLPNFRGTGSSLYKIEPTNGDLRQIENFMYSLISDCD